MRKLAIPLWIPVAALALLLLFVGWRRRAQTRVPESRAQTHLSAVESPPVTSHAPRDAQESPPPSVAAPAPLLAAPAVDPSAAPRKPVVLVHGRIHDESGASLPDAWVRWTDASGREASVNQTGGEYIAGGLEPGRWTASVLVGSGAQSAETLELAPQPTVLEHDILVETQRSVPVFLKTNTGEELYAALRAADADLLVLMRLSLIATRENPPAHLRASGLNQMPGNACGGFTPRQGRRDDALPEGCCGTFEFRAPAPLWIHLVLGNVPIASAHLEEIPDRIEISVDPQALTRACGSVRLRAVDAQNHAVLPEAGAMLGTLQMGGRFLKREGDALVMHGLAPGAYSLEIMAASRCGETREFVLRAAEDLDLGDVSLSAVRPFALHFTDRDEKPRAIEFNLERLVPGDPRATMARFAYRTYRSQPDGTADLQSVSPGRWVVRIDRQLTGNGPGMEEPTLCTRPIVLDTSEPAASVATIVLEPVGELVLLPRSASVRGLRFYLDTPEGLPARTGHLYDGSPLRIGIAPGPYRLSIEDEDGLELLGRSIVIGPKAVEVEVTR